MSAQVMALGWYVRFIPLAQLEATEAHYAGLLQWPRTMSSRRALGAAEGKDYFWGGEAVIVNHNYDGLDVPVSPREAEPDTARLTPIFRVNDLDAITTRLAAKGAVVTPIRPCFHGREAFVRDPMGMLTGLRQIDEDSPLPQDREAVRRRRRGEAFNPGCPPMPSDWQELGWVRLTVTDVPAMTALWRDAFGLPIVALSADRVLLDLGDNVLLELAAGGEARPAPSEQKASLAAVILRVTDFFEFKARLKAAGVAFVHEHFGSAKGDFGYAVDADGNLIGICDRNHPGEYVGKLSVLPEDLEAARRWAETRAAK